MRQVIFATLLTLTPLSATAQEDPSPQERGSGFSLMEEGARLLMQGLMEEMEPALDGLEQSLQDLAPALEEFALSIGPAFADVLDRIDDFRNYQAPEILPNGDIIIRRAPDAPEWPPMADENGAIDL